MDTVQLMDKLFHWRGSVEYEGVTFWVRVVSDAVIEDARRFALLESRRLRKNLRDVDSDDFLIHVDMMRDFSDSDLRLAITNLSSRDVAREFVNLNPKPVLEPLGDYPSQEEQEKYEEAKERRELDYFANLQAHISAWQTEFTAALDRRDRSTLEAMYHKLKTDRVCEDEFSRVFEDFIISAAIYSDAEYRTKFFTYTDYRNLPSTVKGMLRDKYNSLSVDGESVKN